MEEIKRIPTRLDIRDFIITFEYEAFRSHKRKTDKRRIKHFNSEEAKKEFKMWAKKSRTMSNAQILDIKEIEDNKQEIVL
jgi:hypothetical protein